MYKISPNKGRKSYPAQKTKSKWKKISKTNPKFRFPMKNQAMAKKYFTSQRYKKVVSPTRIRKA